MKCVNGNIFYQTEASDSQAIIVWHSQASKDVAYKFTYYNHSGGLQRWTRRYSFGICVTTITLVESLVKLLAALPCQFAGLSFGEKSLATNVPVRTCCFAQFVRASGDFIYARDKSHGVIAYNTGQLIDGMVDLLTWAGRIDGARGRDGGVLMVSAEGR